MNEYINCQLLNIKYDNNKSLYLLNKNSDKITQHKMIFTLKDDIKDNKIHIQFKIFTFLIKSIKFVVKNTTKIITHIDYDGFLFSFDFVDNDDNFEIIFVPTDDDVNNDAKISFKKIIFDIYKINDLIEIKWNNIFIINLKRRIDRKNNMIKKLHSMNINNYEFIDAIDGTDATIIDKFNNQKKNFKTKISTSGHFACLLSHIKAIEIAKNRCYTSIMILEDDVFLCDNFINELEKLKIPNYDVIYLGGIINKKKIFFSKWAKANKILGTYGYILNSNMFDLMLVELNKLANYIDLFLMEKIQPTYKIILLDDFIKTNLDSSDTSNKSMMMKKRLSYIKL